MLSLLLHDQLNNAMSECPSSSAKVFQPSFIAGLLSSSWKNDLNNCFET
jgi:hypothetical protein